MLRMTGLLGCIAPGSFADILILDANPLENIRVLDRPEIHLLAVIKEGRVVSSRIDGLVKGVE
jgi:imidazolonepropionase-like amidohydrolase